MMNKQMNCVVTICLLLAVTGCAIAPGAPAVSAPPAQASPAQNEPGADPAGQSFPEGVSSAPGSVGELQSSSQAAPNSGAAAPVVDEVTSSAAAHAPGELTSSDPAANPHRPDDLTPQQEKVLPFPVSQVKEILLEIVPPVYPAYTIRNPAQIIEICDYLNGLARNEQRHTGEDTTGGGYQLTFTLIDDSSQTVGLNGNSFLVIGGERWEIPYEQASAFDRIASKPVMTALRESGMNAASGRVKSVVSLENGAGKSCELQVEDRTLVVDLTQIQPIIDTTGSGWLILHEGDLVQLFYEQEGDPIVAHTVAILEEAK